MALSNVITVCSIAAVAQSVREFASYTEDWVFESQRSLKKKVPERKPLELYFHLTD